MPKRTDAPQPIPQDAQPDEDGPVEEILDRPNMRVALQEMANEVTRLVSERNEYRRLYLNVIDLREDTQKEAREYWSLLKEMPGKLQEIKDILAEAARGLSGHQKNNGSKKQIEYVLTLLTSLYKEVKEQDAAQ